MPKGGARLRSGPAPDPTALRRERDGKDWTILPERRDGPLPPWPHFMTPPDEAEMAMWERLWELPQALIWEADKIEHTVAVYVRLFIECSQRGASAQRGTLMRQREDSLLLSTPALHAARYLVKADAAAVESTARAAHPSRGASPARAALKVVKPALADDVADED